MAIKLYPRSYLCDVLQQGHSCYLPLNHSKCLQLAAKLNSCGGMFDLSGWMGGGELSIEIYTSSHRFTLQIYM